MRFFFSLLGSVRFGGGSVSSCTLQSGLLGGNLLATFWDNPEELIISGLMATVPLYWIVSWWVIPIFIVCGILWRLGGWSKGNKFFRRLGVPLVVCGSSMLFGVSWVIFLAMPFMVWLAPSYGEKSWLYKALKNDFLTRLICIA